MHTGCVESCKGVRRDGDAGDVVGGGCYCGEGGMGADQFAGDAAVAARFELWMVTGYPHGHWRGSHQYRAESVYGVLESILRAWVTLPK